MGRLGLCALSFAAAVAITAAQSQPPAADLARQLQARYDTVKTFTADLTVSQQSGGVPQAKVAHGTVKVMKPGRINFATAAPDESQIVSNGSELISWTGTKQADRTHLSSDDRSTIMMLLAGRADLNRDFTPSLGPQTSETEWSLTLTPKSVQNDFASLTLLVDRRTLALDGYATADNTGGHVTVRFTNLKENVPLKDGDFTFNHSGVKIVDR